MIAKMFKEPVACPKCGWDTGKDEMAPHPLFEDQDMAERHEISLVWPQGWSHARVLGVDTCLGSIDFTDEDSVDMTASNMPFGLEVPPTHLVHYVGKHICHVWREPPAAEMQSMTGRVYTELERLGVGKPLAIVERYEKAIESLEKQGLDEQKITLALIERVLKET